jgi:hypothetical protein
VPFLEVGGQRREPTIASSAVGLFRRRSREANRDLEPLQPDERAVFDALLAGDGPGMTALREQAERGFECGVARHSYAWNYQVALVLDESRMRAEAIPGSPTVDVDDVVVRAEELQEPSSAKATVHEGMLDGLYIHIAGMTGYPKHLTFTSVSYRQRDGRKGPTRDPVLLEDFEGRLAAPVQSDPAPKWLRDIIPTALRPAPHPQNALTADVERHGHRDTAVLARWVIATDLGAVLLLGGEEHFLTDDGELVIASGVDGSAYTVTRDGRVRHYPLDRSSPEEYGSLRAWLRRLPAER